MTSTANEVASHLALLALQLYCTYLGVKNFLFSNCKTNHQKFTAFQCFELSFKCQCFILNKWVRSFHVANINRYLNKPSHVHVTINNSAFAVKNQTDFLSVLHTHTKKRHLILFQLELKFTSVNPAMS